MKHNTVARRLFPLALALSIAVSMAVPAMADDSTYQITIRPNAYVSTPDDAAASEDASLRAELESRFWAYQIFAGEINAGYAGNRPVNQLSGVQWGGSVKDQDGLLDALKSNDTPAADVGVTFALMLDAKETYLDAPAFITGYKAVYENTGNWDNGALTAEGRAALESAFNDDVKALTLGQLFTAGLNSLSSQDGDAAIAARVISDFTPPTGNNQLARVFAGIVSEKDTYAGGGDYKYLSTTGNGGYQGAYAVSSWTSGAHNAPIEGSWTIGGIDAGYYLIRDAYQENDRWGANRDKENLERANSEYMAAVFGNGTVYVKADAPTVSQSIAGAGKGANFELGKTVAFTLKGELPENYDTAYVGYPYTFHDTMDKGLTYLGGGVYGQPLRVYVRVSNLVDGQLGPVGATYDHYLVDLDPTDGEGADTGAGYRLSVAPGADQTDITITFPNLKSLRGRKVNPTTSDPWAASGEPQAIPTTSSSEIYVEYTAKLNENAIISQTFGSRNRVELRYANDPNWEPKVSVDGGMWGNAWDQAPRGKATDLVHVFEFGLQIQVLDNQKQPLKGAGLALKQTEAGISGYDSDDAPAAVEEPAVSYALLHRLRTKEADEALDTPAEYTYFLAGWVTREALEAYLYPTDEEITRTWDAPLDAGATIGSFHVPTDDAEGGGYFAAILTESDGRVRIEGLDAGSSYGLEEVITPKDYDTADDISIRFTSGYSSSGILDSLTAAVSGNNASTETILRGGAFQGSYAGYQELVARTTFINLPEGYLPDTGGMGTAPFYIGGGVLLAAAAAILILSNAKKRSGKRDK